MELTEKTIVITGGTSGIGLMIVKMLAAKNTIIVIAKNPQRLEQLRAQHPGIETCQCDLSDITQVENTADQITKKHSKIDVLINNAAIQNPEKFPDDDFKYETIQKEITINFTAVCTLIYLLLPGLRSQSSGSIILNVNSGLAIVPKTSSAVYCGTKGAMYIFSQSLKYQLEQTNIKVLQAILPLVDTPMTAGRGSGKITARQAAEAIITGMEKEVAENFIGKTRLLKILIRLIPGAAKKIMKGA